LFEGQGKPAASQPVALVDFLQFIREAQQTPQAEKLWAMEAFPIDKKADFSYIPIITIGYIC
jgi:hypothetical protein